MKKKSIFSLFGILMLIFSLSFTVVHAVPEPDNQNSLTIHFYVQIQGVDTPLPGAEVGICRVADLKFDEHENAVYTLLPEFEALKKYDGTREVTFDGLSVSESIELAQKLAASNPETEKSAVTNTAGDARFDELEQGIYLVRELSAGDKSAEYELFEPYIISVPYYMSSAEPYGWMTDVISDPKTEVKKRPDPSKPESSEPSKPESSEPSKPESSEPSKSESSEPSQPTESSNPESSKPSQVTSPPESTSSVPGEVPPPGEPVLTGSSSLPVLLVMVIFGVSFVLMLVLGIKHRGEG